MVYLVSVYPAERLSDGSAAELNDRVLNRLYATSSAEASVLPPVVEPSLKPALAA